VRVREDEDLLVAARAAVGEERSHERPADAATPPAARDGDLIEEHLAPAAVELTERGAAEEAHGSTAVARYPEDVASVAKIPLRRRRGQRVIEQVRSRVAQRRGVRPQSDDSDRSR
jgi:hypothetical protein